MSLNKSGGETSVGSESKVEAPQSQAVENISENRTEHNNEVEKKIIDSQLQSLQIEVKDLDREIPDFKFLSAGQKVLALENLKQNILGEIKEDSLSIYQSKFSQIKGEGWGRINIDNAGVLAKNIWLGISKTYQLKKGEKDREKELLAGGLEAHKETLEILTKGLKAYGPEAEIKKDGSLQINYLNKLEGADQAEQKIVAGFNEAATALAKIPDEWRYDSAKPADRKKFLLAEKNYEANKALALNILAQKEGSEVKAAIKMNEISSQIRLNSFLNSNPEVETQLLKIKDQSLITGVVSGVARERGLYMLAGYASRTFAVLGLGALGTIASAGGVMAGAGIIGYIRSFNRAKQTIGQKDIMGRRGGQDEGELSKIFALGGGKIAGTVDATNEISVGLGEKINYLVGRLENETDETKKIKLAGQLKTRLEYTKKYLDNGAVNFGPKKERLNNQMNLLTGMAQAETYLDLVDKDDKQRKLVETKIQEKIYDVLDDHDKQISQERQKYVVKQAEKGMMMAIGAALVGRLLAEFRHGLEGSSEGHTGVLRQAEIKPRDIATVKPLGGGHNGQEIVNYLTNDPALKGNLDLKTTLLNQKLSVNVLAKGESIGTYVHGVGNDTPVTFVQPNGSVEVHGAGEVYVHPGDRVIQGEDGHIYVIKDSGVRGVRVNENLVDQAPKVNENNIELLKGKQPSQIDMDNSDPLSRIKNIVKMQEDKNGSSVNKTGIIDKIKGLLGGNKKVTDMPKVEVPNSFAGNKEVDVNLINEWNLLSAADKVIYNNFANNSALYSTNPDLAITNFLGQTPAEIIHHNTEIVVTLKNGHELIFDIEDGQKIFRVDDGNYEIVNPEKIIAARKLIQTNLAGGGNAPVKDASNFVEDNLKTISHNNVPVTKNDLINLDNGFWDARPNVKMLEFNHADFTPAQEVQIQNLYNERLEVLNEIQKQYNALALKYADNPQFEHFTHVIKTYYSVENGTVKSLVDGSSNPSKFGFDINELLKEKQNPKLEVSEHMKRIVSKTLLKQE